MFDIFELFDEARGPGDKGNGLTVIGSGKGAELVNSLFVVRDEAVVEAG